MHGSQQPDVAGANVESVGGGKEDIGEQNR